MPLFDRLHRPDALVYPRQPDDQPVARELQTTICEESNENRVQRPVYHTSVHEHDILPQHFAPVAATRPALQGHVNMADPPLPNPHSSTQAIGSMLPPTLQGVVPESGIMRSSFSRAQMLNNAAFYGAPSCDFASPTTLTTPFTTMTPGPGTPPTYDGSVFGFRRVDSSFSGFNGLQMSPTTAPTSVGSTVIGYATPKVRMGGYMAEPLLQKQELERLQQKLLQQQIMQQEQMQETQSPAPIKGTDEVLPSPFSEPEKRTSKLEELQLQDVVQPKLSDENETHQALYSEYQSSSAALTLPESSRKDDALHYSTPEQIQQQQRDFMLSQQQKYTSFHLSRRPSTVHPSGLPPSPAPQAMEAPRTSPRPFEASPPRSLGSSPRVFGSSLSNSFNKSERFPRMSTPPPFAPMHSCGMQALAGMPPAFGPAGPGGPFGMPGPFGGPMEMGPGGMGPPGFPMPGLPGMPGLVPPIPGMMPF